MKTVAILGPTASGKSDLAIRVAKEVGGVILSLDSLSIYKEIDIASAKPSLKERKGVKHFGIDLINVNEPFNVAIFANLFEEAKGYAKKANSPLIIVGGTGFYLKILLEGISELPTPDDRIVQEVARVLKDLPSAYRTISALDSEYAKRISPSDRYRIEKGLLIYHLTSKTPTDYFKENPPVPLLKSVELYEIGIEKEILNERIEKRTEKMFEAGLVDEVANLEYRYGRLHNPMKAIGIKEVLDYFDGKLTLDRTKERIVIATRQLAKRQRTFNKTQLPPHPLLSADEIFEKIVES